LRPEWMKFLRFSSMVCSFVINYKVHFVFCVRGVSRVCQEKNKGT
jgi:hypothetical protein